MGTVSKSFQRTLFAKRTVGLMSKFYRSDHRLNRFHGGWLAPNMYFLGFAGCVQVNGIRIAGASGIYNERNYTYGDCFSSQTRYSFFNWKQLGLVGHFERIPFDDNSMRSIYHTREFDIFRLSQVISIEIESRYLTSRIDS